MPPIPWLIWVYVAYGNVGLGWGGMIPTGNYRLVFGRKFLGSNEAQPCPLPYASLSTMVSGDLP